MNKGMGGNRVFQLLKIHFRPTQMKREKNDKTVQRI